MTLVDVWAFLMAVTASACLALRANMLKPSFEDWCSAPTAVWLSLYLLSVVLAGSAISIAGGGHATGREAACYTALAIAASIMLVNLQRQMVEARDAAADEGRAGAEQ